VSIGTSKFAPQKTENFSQEKAPCSKAILLKGGRAREEKGGGNHCKKPDETHEGEGEEYL